LRFSDNGLYIEKYLKCANCGMLVYGQGIERVWAGKAHLYCSDWCVDWARRRAAHDGYFRLPIVQPKSEVEARRRAKSSPHRRPIW
jgi:5-oxoprolinase (ATP-hydrolysing)/N-methylhydantoinase B